MKHIINRRYCTHKIVKNEEYGDTNVVIRYSKRAAELEESDFDSLLSKVFNEVWSLDDFGIVELCFYELSFLIERYPDNRFNVRGFDGHNPAYYLDKTLSQVAKVKDLVAPYDFCVN